MTNNQNLEPGQIVTLQGVVRFSHITRRYEGEALERRIEQQKSINVKYPTKKPHTTLSLTNVQVIPGGDNGQYSAADQFVGEKIYSSEKSPENGNCFQIDSKGAALPKMGWIDDSRQVHPITKPKGEIAQGTPVVILVRIFYAKDWGKWGMELDTVASLGEMKYYSAGDNETEKAFSRLGITFTEALQPITEDTVDAQSQDQNSFGNAPAESASMPAANPVNNTVNHNGFNMPGNINTQPAANPSAIGVTNTGSPFGGNAPTQQVPWNNNNGGASPAPLPGITFGS